MMVIIMEIQIDSNIPNNLQNDRYTCDGRWYPQYQKPVSGVIISFVDQVNIEVRRSNYGE